MEKRLHIESCAGPSALAQRRLTFVRCVLSFCSVLLFQTAPAQLNVSLFGRSVPDPFRYSGCWSYVAPSGKEYGLVGGYNGTYVIVIDDSMDIRQVGFVAGPQSNWREITVIGSHAYVVSAGGGALAGMQVISLAPLPDSVHLVTTYRSTFTTGHIIMRDIYTDSAYVYVSGASATGGVHILDVTNPASPVEVGVYDPLYYIHDAHIRGNRLYASAGAMRQVDIVDISNKTNPTYVTRIQYSGSYTHSCWTTDDHNYLFVTDEQDGQPARIWNIEETSAITEVARYSANPQSLVHNPYIRGHYVFIAHNTEGLRVVDIADPTVPVEVGYYDTYPGPSGGFNGLWSTCPYLPSGKIIGGDRTGGLYVWKFNNTKAARVYGTVRDSLTNQPISLATILIVESGKTAIANPEGKFKIGDLPGIYTFRVTKAGYATKQVTNVGMIGADSLTMEILLSTLTNANFDRNDKPGSFALHQNHPNPFNPTTAIAFSIPEASMVTLRIIDLMGKEVATIVNETLSAGDHQRTFDVPGLSSGIYFYQLKSGRFVETKKMVLIR